MQTLNVDSTRSNIEHQAVEEQRRTELLKDAYREANFFFLAAAMAACGTGVALVQLGFFVRVGAIDLLTYYVNGNSNRFLILGTAVTWVIVLFVLGFIARTGYRTAFFVGIVLYGLDMLLLIATFSIGSFGVHAFFVYRWYLGQKALREAKEISTQSSAINI